MLAAMLSSAIGGTAVGAARYLAGAVDPITLGSLRFGAGCAILAPVALLRGDRWPGPRDWAGVAAVGAVFFALFPALFNASLAFTTAARGALALATLPLLTMLVAAFAGVEPLTWRKSAGVVIALAGVASALVTGLAAAPLGAWRGDLLMVAAASCMALASVWSRPFIRRSGPMTFTAASMAAGSSLLAALAAWRGGFGALATLSTTQWTAVAYLGVFGGAVSLFLWVFALARTTPTLVAVSITVNPISASILGALLLDEPIRPNLLIGLVAVLAGILVASTGGARIPPAAEPLPVVGGVGPAAGERP